MNIYPQNQLNLYGIEEHLQILISLGKSTYDDLNLLKQKLDLQCNKVSGIILI